MPLHLTHEQKETNPRNDALTNECLAPSVLLIQPPLHILAHSSLFWKRGTEASLGGRYDPDASRYARIID
jgi:hypothetical protein